MVDSNRNIDMVRESARHTQDQVVPPLNIHQKKHGSGHGGDVHDETLESGNFGKHNIPTAYDYAVAKAVQSVAQTTAVAIQDAANLMRNISTEETVAIGVAMAKWIAEPEKVMYEKVINKSLDTIKETAKAFKEIGDSAVHVLQQLDQ
ncbi:hypothetical protein [Gimesia aquarii]|uniref:Phasin protein n=1 Tax=Gimesia aquarii TaxID=2527964 RepID=A0A517VV37_9PLAN|nr:hypothetical protein [Gimesia aquarii]QDT96851.1 hypothetical protein V144x_23090 [Gimesia aquarii]